MKGVGVELEFKYIFRGVHLLLVRMKDKPIQKMYRAMERNPIELFILNVKS